MEDLQMVGVHLEMLNNQLRKKLAIQVLWALCHLLAGTRDTICGSTALVMPE